MFCTLDSNPSDIDFDWFVQTGLKKTDKIRWNFSIVNETTSRATIDLSRFEQPSVTVECEGKNDIGLQRLPCVLQLSKSKYRRNRRQLLASREKRSRASGAEAAEEITLPVGHPAGRPASHPATHSTTHQPKNARRHALSQSPPLAAT